MNQFRINPIHVYIDSAVRVWSTTHQCVCDYSLSKTIYDLITKLNNTSNKSFSVKDLKKLFLNLLDSKKIGILIKRLKDIEFVIPIENIRLYTGHLEEKHLTQSLLKKTLTRSPFFYFILAQKLGYNAQYHDPFTVSIEFLDRIHWFHTHVAVSLVDIKSIEFVKNKSEVNQYLREKGITTPRSTVINISLLNDISLKNITFPVTIKPLFGMGSANVLCNIRNGPELNQALTSIKQSNLELGDKYLIEEYVEGITLRWLYGADQVLSAICISKPEITGDGKTNLRNLILKKTGLNEIHPSIHFKLTKEHLTFDTILKKNTKWTFSDTASPAQKGHMVEWKNRVPETLNVKIAKICNLTNLKLAAIEAIIPVANGQYLYDDAKFIDINPVPDLFAQLTDEKVFSEDIIKPFLQWAMTAPTAKPLKTLTKVLAKGKTHGDIINYFVQSENA